MSSATTPTSSAAPNAGTGGLTARLPINKAVDDGEHPPMPQESFKRSPRPQSSDAYTVKIDQRILKTLQAPEIIDQPGHPNFPAKSWLEQLRISFADQLRPGERPVKSQTSWAVQLLKAYQMLAVILDGSDADGVARLQTNALETNTLWNLITNKEGDDHLDGAAAIYGESSYLDYHAPSSDSTSSTKVVSATVPSKPGEQSPTPSQASVNTNVLCNEDLYFCFRSGCWVDCSDPCEILDRFSSKPGEPLEFISRREDGGVVITVDQEIIEMAVTCWGRYDAYLLAIFATLLLPLKFSDPVPDTSPPSISTLICAPSLLARDWQMCRNRSVHAIRVYKDATGPYKLTESRYQWYLTLLTSGSLRAVQDTFHDLALKIWHSQFLRSDQESLKRLERLLVALLGHDNDMARSQATVFLNNLYDLHDWQQKVPFLPVVRCVGDRFTVKVTIKDIADPKGVSSTGTNVPIEPQGVYLLLSAPSFDTNTPAETYSYHPFKWSPAGKDKHYRQFGVTAGAGSAGQLHTWIGTLDLGSFPRCGYYDWRVVRCDPESGSWNVAQSTMDQLRDDYESSYSFVNLATMSGPGDSTNYKSKNLWTEIGRLTDPEGGSTAITLPIQGRFIVQTNSAREMQLHEVVVDQFAAEYNAQGAMIEPGTFAGVAQRLEKLHKQGINSVYMSGCLARDNGTSMSTANGGRVWERPNASPFAATCRSSPCNMLGGERGFRDVIKESEKLGMSIILDGYSRISCSHFHRKYQDSILWSVDEWGRKHILYRSEESCILNYRKVETWDLFVEDILTWATNYKCHGIKIEQAHIVPNMLPVDHHEMTRMDPDGQSHYTADEQLRGEIVLPNTGKDCGFWNSSAAMSHWPNPILVRLCREIWRYAPEFIFIGDCASLPAGAEKRYGILARSGVIPQTTTLPEILSGLFGKKLTPDGNVESGRPPTTVHCISRWFEKTHEYLPDGALMIRSSCSETSPLPALLYGRGVWPATDYLFFSSDIPCTTMGEEDGLSYRLGAPNVFKVATETSGDESSISPALRKPQSIYGISSSNASPPIAKFAKHSSCVSLLGRVRNLNAFEPPESRQKLEDEYAREIGPEFGFDLKRICDHYKHRRDIRKRFEILRNGSMVILPVIDKNGEVMDSVIGFCRFNLLLSNIMIFGIINFSEKAHNECYLSLKFLTKHFSSIHSGSIIQCWDIMSSHEAADGDGSPHARSVEPNSMLAMVCDRKISLMTLSEIVSDNHKLSVDGYKTSCLGLRIINPDAIEAGRAADTAGGKKDLDLALFISSMLRLEEGTDPRRIRSNLVAQSIVNAVKSLGDVSELANILSSIAQAQNYRHALTSCTAAKDLFQLFVDTRILTEDDESWAVRCFAKMERIRECLEEYHNKTGGGASSISSDMHELASGFLRSNDLGPLVFMTPELGKWSVIGGLGVMVDELSRTIGEELHHKETWCISPYYHRNRNNQTDYLKYDNIHWKYNIEVQVGPEQVVLGVHEGRVNGVNLIFVHNERYFPYPYPDYSTIDMIKYLTIIGKAFLQILCTKKIIPSIIVTNDWVTGLVPAYGKKSNIFSNIFYQTTFLHICHNFDQSYEGRIYLHGKNEDYSWIHGLSRDLLIDPLWNQCIINPSRCALLSCDQWATVSNSYKDDLLNSSPLSYLLNIHKKPFATPNGIPIKIRKQRLWSCIQSYKKKDGLEVPEQEGAVPSISYQDHIYAKGIIQKKYFGFEESDEGIPLFAFIGRITSQKGVQLILDLAESIILRYNHRIQVLIGGKVSWNDPYSSKCGHQMMQLKQKYPWSFWADPNQFFTDGPLVNLGADFGLMPSLFEPGGIVQQEFFVAGTPVIAFRTGGLKDTVTEFNLETLTGNGFTFAAYNLGDFLFAIERANRVYQDQQKYLRLREMCEASCISTEQCATNWMKEFYRLRGKFFINPRLVNQVKKELGRWEPGNELADSTRARIARMLKERAAATRRSAGSDESSTSLGGRGGIRRPVRVKYVTKRSPRSVAISGTFDEWKIRRPLTWDPAIGAFTVTLALPVGQYSFKFIVDGDWLCSDQYPKGTDSEGIENNLLTVE